MINLGKHAMIIRRGVGLAMGNWFDNNLDMVVGDDGNIFFGRSFDLAENRLLSVAQI